VIEIVKSISKGGHPVVLIISLIYCKFTIYLLSTQHIRTDVLCYTPIKIAQVCETIHPGMKEGYSTKGTEAQPDPPPL